MSDCMSPEKVNEGFLVAPPLIDQQIKDLSIKHPNWMGSLFDIGTFQTGAGGVMEEIIYRSSLPQIERGLDKWTKVGSMAGCDPCGAPSCAYNWTTFGGHGFDRKLIELMKREFRTPAYCVHEIQSTFIFKKVMAKVIENIYKQTDFFKEFSVGQNLLTGFAKKFLIDSGGIHPNTNNPYVYRPAGTARLSILTMGILEEFYEQLRRLPDCIPYDVIDSSPIYALEAGHQVLAGLYRNDPQLRRDVHFSSYATSMLEKYNFISSIRGMYIPAPILYPRRFNLSAVTGEPIEVLPFMNDVPAEVGTYTYVNPGYAAATHEEVTIHGMYPFTILTQATETTLGGGTSFGPEPTFMESWSWHNPETQCDPFKREGFFATAAKMAVAPQHSEGIFAFLVERPRASQVAMFNPEPTCPPETVTCNNNIPAVECPCPVVLSISANPFVQNNYTLVFATAVSTYVGQSLQLVYRNGAIVSGVVTAYTTDGKTIALTISGGLDAGTCADIISLQCVAPVGACSSKVVMASDCRSGETDTVDLLLEQALIAQTAGDDLTAYFGNCTTAVLDIVSVDAENLVWTVRYATGNGPSDAPTGGGVTKLSADMLCDRGGIIKVCVTQAIYGCPACEPSMTECPGITDYDYSDDRSPQ